MQTSRAMHRSAVKVQFYTGTLSSRPEANSAPCLTHQEYYNWIQWGSSFCAMSAWKQWSEGSEQRCIRLFAQSSQQLCMQIHITLAGGLVAFLRSLSPAGGFCPCCCFWIPQKMEKGKSCKERELIFSHVSISCLYAWVQIRRACTHYSVAIIVNYICTLLI